MKNFVFCHGERPRVFVINPERMARGFAPFVGEDGFTDLEKAYRERLPDAQTMNAVVDVQHSPLDLNIHALATVDGEVFLKNFLLDGYSASRSFVQSVFTRADAILAPSRVQAS